jgi:hypothetical protein
MEVSYEALRRIIQDEIQKLMKADNNPALVQYEGDEESTRYYCKDLVRGELSNEFIKNLNRIEKATKGSLDEESTSAGTKSKNKNQGKSLHDTRIKISKSKNQNPDDVIEDEIEKPTKGELTQRRDDLFGGWKDFRQQSKLIYSTNESYEVVNERWKRYKDKFNKGN